jgi:hypothetical protein
MRVPAQCPQCRRVDERRQSMYEVSSGTRSREPDAVYLKRWMRPMFIRGS